MSTMFARTIAEDYVHDLQQQVATLKEQVADLKTDLQDVGQERDEADNDLERARTIAVALEQENAHLQAQLNTRQ